MNDLFLQLLDYWINRGSMPDVLSIEESFDGENIIRCKWFSGKIMEFGFLVERWEIASNLFNSYWKSANKALNHKRAKSGPVRKVQNNSKP